MAKIDWGYLRTNCTSCDRARQFFSEHRISIETATDARKSAIPASQALSVVAGMAHLYVTRGKKVIHRDLGEAGAEAEITDLIVGRSGNLRAPALKIKDTLVVGFDEELYRRVLLSKGWRNG